MRCAGAPISCKRRASSLVCARKRSIFCRNCLSRKRKRWYPRHERSELLALTTATAAPLAFARRRTLGHNSVSAITRSEERRVGKECRYGWVREECKGEQWH